MARINEDWIDRARDVSTGMINVCNSVRGIITEYNLRDLASTLKKADFTGDNSDLTPAIMDDAIASLSGILHSFDLNAVAIYEAKR